MIVFNKIVACFSNIRQLFLLIFRYNPFASNLIIFFINGKDSYTKKEYVNGGIISILSLAAESKRIFAKDKNSQIVVCSSFNEIYIDKYRKIENSIDIFTFNIIFFYFKKAKYITIHIPEWRVNDFSLILTSARYYGLQNKAVHLNVLNQNTQLMPPVAILREVSKRFIKTTITTAHDRYCNTFYRAHYELPLHLMSVYVTSEDYIFKGFREKRKILVYSADSHPLKANVLRELQRLDWLVTVEIRDMTFARYKELISEAMFSLTFGEGLDGYFVEPIFSGAIGIAVYNDDFFPEDFKGKYTTVYSDYNGLIQNLVRDISYFSTSIDVFEKYQKNLHSHLAQIYNKKKYRTQLEKFYNGDYTFV